MIQLLLESSVKKMGELYSPSELLILVKQHLDNHNIPFWLDMGTLLGAVREGKIIQGDNDVDVGIFRNDNIESLCLSLSNEDLSVKLFETKILVVAENIDLDIYIYDKEGDYAVRTWYRHNLFWSDLLNNNNLIRTFLSSLSSDDLKSSVKKCSNQAQVFLLHLIFLLPFKFSNYLFTAIDKIQWRYYWVSVPISVFNNLKQINMYEHLFSIPVSSEEYIMMRYGKDWQIPNSSWSQVDLVRTELTSGIIDIKRTYTAPSPVPIRVW